MLLLEGRDGHGRISHDKTLPLGQSAHSEGGSLVDCMSCGDPPIGIFPQRLGNFGQS